MRTKKVIEEGEGFNQGNFETREEGTSFIEIPAQNRNSNTNMNFKTTPDANIDILR